MLRFSSPIKINNKYIKFSDYDASVRSQNMCFLCVIGNISASIAMSLLQRLYFLSNLEIHFIFDAHCLLQSDRLIWIMFTFPVHRAYVYGHRLLTVLTLTAVLALHKTENGSPELAVRLSTGNYLRLFGAKIE